MPLAIICTIGLPGCGKSSFCSNVHQILEKDCQHRIGCIHISFDELQKASSTMFLTDETQLDEADLSLTSYKLFRYSVLRSVELIIQHIRDGLPVTLPDLLNTADAQNHVMSQIMEASSADNICILVDDNMYYQSMRYPYYKLARKYGVGYGQVYINVPLDKCLMRNSFRHCDNRVDEHVIVRMKERLEPPDSAVNTWEKYSIEFQQPPTTADLLSFVMSCLAHPVPAVAVSDTSSKEESMQITAEDIVHQSDLSLRQLVKVYITAAKSAGSGDVKELAVRANHRRKSLLSYVRSRSVELSGLLSDARQRYSRNPESELYQFLDRMFSEELAS